MNLTGKNFKRYISIFAFACVALPCRVSAAPVLGLDKTGYEIPSHSVMSDRTFWSDRPAMIEGIDGSLKYLKGAEAERVYQQLGSAEITRERVEKSLLRLKEIISQSAAPEEIQKQIKQEFSLYRAKGYDGKGAVKFTGYYQPTYRASRVHSREFSYPIYFLPPHFPVWDSPHPTRVELEGFTGSGGPDTLLHGHELAWLRNRYEVFMIHLQGSAILEFEDDHRISIGYAAGTSHPFKGISAAFLKTHGVSWNKLEEFFTGHPALFNEVISRNNRFVFFRENPQSTPLSSIGVPVVPGRSIATDKLRFPPGAVGLIRANLPEFSASGRVHLENSYRFVLDHDSGSAIKGAGRVDLYMGTGPQAQRLANHLYGIGQLYYLLLKQPPSKPFAAKLSVSKP